MSGATLCGTGTIGHAVFINMGGTLGVSNGVLTIAGHKFEGPKGVGALFLRHGTNILAQQHGGPQERYRRAGTEDVASAVAMAAAFELAVAERGATAPHLAELREALLRRLLRPEGVTLTGHPTERLPGLLSVVAAGVQGSAITMALDLAGLACSTGSACVTGSNEPSHVLAAMGYPADESAGALRFSLGRSTTAAEVADAGELIATAIESHREAEERYAVQRAALLSQPGEAAVAGSAALGADAE